jgi:hypothetical protein
VAGERGAIPIEWITEVELAFWCFLLTGSRPVVQCWGRSKSRVLCGCVWESWGPLRREEEEEGVESDGIGEEFRLLCLLEIAVEDGRGRVEGRGLVEGVLKVDCRSWKAFKASPELFSSGYTDNPLC